MMFDVELVAEAWLGFGRGGLAMRSRSLGLLARLCGIFLGSCGHKFCLMMLTIVLPGCLHLKVLALLAFATELKFELLALLLNFADYYASTRSRHISTRLTIGSIEDTHFLD